VIVGVSADWVFVVVGSGLNDAVSVEDRDVEGVAVLDAESLLDAVVVFEMENGWVALDGVMVELMPDDVEGDSVIVGSIEPLVLAVAVAV
jgi:hypothetical protein